MIVCHCHGITDRDVRAAVERGAADLSGLARVCRAGTDCRGCLRSLMDLLATPHVCGARHAVDPPSSGEFRTGRRRRRAASAPLR